MQTGLCLCCLLGSRLSADMNFVKMHTTLISQMIDVFSLNDVPFVAMWGNHRVLYLNESSKRSRSQKSAGRLQENICWKGICPISGQEQLSPRNCLLLHRQKVFLTGNTIG